MQIKRSEPTATHLVSEPAACPYCVQENFGVTYVPPQWRAGIGSDGSVRALLTHLKSSAHCLSRVTLTLSSRPLRPYLVPQISHLWAHGERALELTVLRSSAPVWETFMSIAACTGLLISLLRDTRRLETSTSLRSNPARLGGKTRCSSCCGRA